MCIKSGTDVAKDRIRVYCKLLKIQWSSGIRLYDGGLWLIKK